jgi:hypothetical protein
MNDFDPKDSNVLPLWKRFPEDCIGYQVLRNFEGEDPAALRDLLGELVVRERTTPKRRKLLTPRVFISHRQKDERLARRFAQIARGEGFTFWLDVLDPALQWATKNQNPDPIRQAFIIAILIEMALLNCSHVLAVVTRHTAGSLWLPYEYGRVKCATMFSSQATAWLNYRLHRTNSYAEYLRLGAVHRSKLDVQQWMRDEMKKWKRLAARIGPQRWRP